MPGPHGDLATVALDLPVRQEFTYLVGADLSAELKIGARVRVPFGRRTELGIVVALPEVAGVAAERLKPITALLDKEPLVSPSLLLVTRELAQTYACSWGEALAAVLPAAVKRRPTATLPALVPVAPPAKAREAALVLEETSEKRARVLRTVVDYGEPMPMRELLRRTGVTESPVKTLVRAGHLRVVRVPQRSEFETGGGDGEVMPARHDLSAAQQTAVDQILPCIAAREHAVFLLHGVTGSGKTEVYLRILEAVRAAGRGAVILVPEIALTPQTVGRFRARFAAVAVLHSGMTDAQRAGEWRRLARGEAAIAIGARSALFAPVRDLGLIVMDEEHEGTFKQQNAPRYHAREVACIRGRIEHAPVLLGSATPSLESWGRAKKGTYHLLSLPARVGGGQLPEVRIVDMRLEPRGQAGGRSPFFSRALMSLLEDRLPIGDQAMVFLNRRGYAPVLFCGHCGQSVKCERCSVSLTLHLASGRLQCHYCMAQVRRPELCPMCRQAALHELGFGTEKVQVELQRLLPRAVVARMDADTMRKREDYEKALRAFRDKKINVLVGTQMIAKGLDFPAVTVVGVLAAEVGLFQPDFRAEERTFQLLSQVSGRAGRGARRGTVIIQTLCPDNEVIRLAALADYQQFVERQLGKRQAAGYPPFMRLIRVIVEGTEEARARDMGASLRAELAAPLAAARCVLLGPAPAPVARIKERFRWHLLVKAPDMPSFERARDAVAALESRGDRRLRVLVDVDPASML